MYTFLCEGTLIDLPSSDNKMFLNIVSQISVHFDVVSHNCNNNQ